MSRDDYRPTGGARIGLRRKRLGSSWKVSDPEAACERRSQVCSASNRTPSITTMKILGDRGDGDATQRDQRSALRGTKTRRAVFTPP